MTTTLRKKLTSKGISSPDSKTKPLYNNNSSKSTIILAPDSYQHPNHGEPMDLGSEVSKEEEEGEE